MGGDKVGTVSIAFPSKLDFAREDLKKGVRWKSGWQLTKGKKDSYLNGQWKGWVIIK